MSGAKGAVSARANIVAAALLFSTGGAAIKFCSLSGFSVAAFRSLVAALALVALVPAARARWTWRTPLVGLAYAATLILFVLSNKLTTAAAAIYLQTSAPLYLLLLGPWLLGEPTRRRDFGGIALLAAGLALMFVGADAPQATAPRPLLGNVLAAASGLTYALMIAGLRWLGKKGGEQASSLPAVVAGNVIAVVVCLPFASGVAAAGASDWGAILFLGVFQIGLAYACMTRGIVHVPALTASLLLLFEPVLNPFWTWLVEGERPGLWTLCGGALVLSATAFQARR